MDDMYDYQIRAAFEAATDAEYLHDVGLNPADIADHCSAVIQAVTEFFPDPHQFDTDEDFQTAVMREAFVRVFEAGLRVGLEIGEEGIEVRVHLTRDQVAGLAQSVLSGSDLQKQ